MKNKNINIITLGCSKNTVDSEKLLKQLDAGGFKVHHNSELPSGTVIINTCGFINDAREESIDTILYYAREKEAGNIDSLYVIGCLSERYKDDLQKEIPDVDRYFGVNNLSDIVQELKLKVRRELLLDRIVTGPGHYAYLKISEGCDRTCSFCAIPAIRGNAVSRPLEEIYQEAEKLSLKGVKELILVAQDLSYYGLDLYKKQMLPRLVEELLQIEKLDWIRLHYLYPANFPSGLIPLIKNNDRICSYIDLPVQHISDKVLAKMKRSHTGSETRALLDKLRGELPEAAIRTTLIAGHPGEGEKEFNELFQFVSDFRFDRLGVFKYSHEEGTHAWFNYSDEVPDHVKESRVSAIMELQQEISRENNENNNGRLFRVLVDRKEGEHYIGRTEYDSPEVDQEVLIPSKYNLNPGEFYNIRITESDSFDLYGEPV